MFENLTATTSEVTCVGKFFAAIILKYMPSIRQKEQVPKFITHKFSIIPRAMTPEQSQEGCPECPVEHCVDNRVDGGRHVA